MSRQTKIAILLVSITVLASSCSARKKMVQPTPQQSFEWLTAKFDIQVEGSGLSFDDLSGQLRMRKDSLVWLSVTAPMGVEVARVKVSTDSVWVINRLEKTYLAEPLADVAQHFGMPIGLPWIETLLLDNNEGVPPVENQMILLKNFAFGNYSAKVKYNKIQLNEETTFPLKITDKMERILLPKMK